MMCYKLISISLVLLGLLRAQATPDNGVLAAKAKLAKALLDTEAAWAEYVQEYGGGSVMNLIAGPKTRNLPEPARTAVFKPCFQAALRDMDSLNKAAGEGGTVVYGINSLAHLCKDDFAALHASRIHHKPRRPRVPAQPTPSLTRNSRRAVVDNTADRASGGRPHPPPSPPVPAPKCTDPTHCQGEVEYPYTSVIPAPSVDWVASGFLTRARDMGACYASAVFATTVATEWLLIQRSASAKVNGKRKGYYTNVTTDLSEDDLMECEPLFDGCNPSGLSITQHDYAVYFHSASLQGQGLEQDFPYDASDSRQCPYDTTRANIKAALNLKWALVPQVVPGQATLSDTDLAKAVSMAPTMVLLYVNPNPDAMGFKWQYYGGGIAPCSADNGAKDPFPPNLLLANHAASVVGYGETTASDNITIIKYYTIKNSWGDHWGEHGFIRVQRDCAQAYPSGSPNGPFNMLSFSPVVPVM